MGIGVTVTHELGLTAERAITDILDQLVRNQTEQVKQINLISQLLEHQAEMLDEVIRIKYKTQPSPDAPSTLDERLFKREIEEWDEIPDPFAGLR